MNTRTRKPTAERREEIVKAVLRIIGERGLTSLTTKTLADEVGVTSGALFRHFASRDAILREVVRYALGRIEETFPETSLPPVERLLELARGRVRLLGSDPGLAWLLRSKQASLTVPEGAREQLREVVKRSKKYLLDAIREGAAQGSIRDDILPELLLVPVMGTIHALVGLSGAHRAATRSRRQSPDKVLEALMRMLAPPKSASSRKRGALKPRAAGVKKHKPKAAKTRRR